MITAKSHSHSLYFSMDSSLSPSKPLTALPSHLMNGHSHASHSSSPLGKTSVKAKELNSLTASIKSSHSGRQPLYLDPDFNELPQTNGQASYPPNEAHKEHEELDSPLAFDVSPRDPRDEDRKPAPLVPSRPASPYTLNPPIDFDGLSWPSECAAHAEPSPG